jgi:hypothetical protein
MTQPYLLNRDDLEKLTGYKRAKKQCAWLDKQRITYSRDRSGYPVVLADEVNRHFERLERAA